MENNNNFFNINIKKKLKSSIFFPSFSKNDAPFIFSQNAQLCNENNNSNKKKTFRCIFQISCVYTTTTTTTKMFYYPLGFFSMIRLFVCLAIVFVLFFLYCFFLLLFRLIHNKIVFLFFRTTIFFSHQTSVIFVVFFSFHFQFLIIHCQFRNKQKKQ